MQRVDIANQSVIDLESHFQGLLYSKCDGLETRGKRKNVYTETFADTDEIEVWQGENVTREATNITFTFFFIGDNRQQTLDSFYEYIKNGTFYYWDTKRLKKAYIFLEEELSVKEDVYHGSKPYKSVELKFKNIWGECKKCNDKGVLL